MAIKPEKITILDMDLKVYDLGTHLNVYREDGKYIGMIQREHFIEDTYRVSAVGPAGTNGPKEGLNKALKRVVRLWRISNPQASLVSSDRVNYTILEEEIYVHSFRLCPLLAVWTVSGHPLGTLDPVGMLWRRGCAQEP